MGGAHNDKIEDLSGLDGKKLEKLNKRSIKSDMDELKRLEKERDILNIRIKCLKMKLGLIQCPSYNYAPKLKSIISYWIGSCKERRK